MPLRAEQSRGPRLRPGSPAPEPSHRRSRQRSGCPLSTAERRRPEWTGGIGRSPWQCDGSGLVHGHASACILSGAWRREMPDTWTGASRLPPSARAQPRQGERRAQPLRGGSGGAGPAGRAGTGGAVAGTARPRRPAPAARRCGCRAGPRAWWSARRVAAARLGEYLPQRAAVRALHPPTQALGRRAVAQRGQQAMAPAATPRAEGASARRGGAQIGAGGRRRRPPPSARGRSSSDGPTMIPVNSADADEQHARRWS